MTNLQAFSVTVSVVLAVMIGTLMLYMQPAPPVEPLDLTQRDNYQIGFDAGLAKGYREGWLEGYESNINDTPGNEVLPLFTCTYVGSEWKYTIDDTIYNTWGEWR